MLKCHGGWSTLIPHTLLPVSSNYNNSTYSAAGNCSSIKALKRSSDRVSSTHCWARRRVRYDEEDEEDGEENGHNAEIAMLELYSQTARDEALLVKALVDGQEVEVLIFKGFSSCLSYKTSPDPSKSVLPARAVIKSIDRIKGPFDPSNIEYLEKEIAWETFKTRFLSY
ncbi:uncharacterized protein LOC132302467 [Cornus florida]|uniref:uncharacterized protein LOC132302467 n=1 Tax=Cornus florida TaxID=4283 RepID=UPI00289AC35A|nr:uncharacterized protein LOC132302467 [Cornus florida]